MKILNEKGLSIISAVVAAALVGIVSITVMQLMKNASNANTFSKSSMDYLDLAREVTLLVSNSSDCRVSLEGASFRGSTIQNTPVTVELWTSDQEGKRSRLRVTSDETKNESQFGQVKIHSVSFTMPDYRGGDFPEGYDQFFKGELEIIADKRITIEDRRQTDPIIRTLRLFFDTDDKGESTIKGCISLAEVANEADVETTACKWYNAVNSATEPVDFACLDNEVLTGVQSTFESSSGDRVFSFQCCRATISGAQLTKRYSVYSGFFNDKNGVANFHCPTPSVYSGMRSTYSSTEKDRQFSAECSNIILTTYTRMKDCEISNYSNWWEEDGSFTCSPNKILVGEMSHHDNSYDDRRFRYKCCSLVAR